MESKNISSKPTFDNSKIKSFNNTQNSNIGRKTNAVNGFKHNCLDIVCFTFFDEVSGFQTFPISYMQMF